MDLVAPRSCVVCGGRLSPRESHLCLACNLHLPRTHHLDQPYDNDMARTFWGRIPHIERAAALVYHHGGAQSSYPVYLAKYTDRPELAHDLGLLMAEEMLASSFLEGIEAIVPVPLSADRLRQRGYNQSLLMARGMAEVSRLPVLPDVVGRKAYHASQTTYERWGRQENVAHAFTLLRPEAVAHRHILLVDDIVTTGATVCACAQALGQAEGVSISVASYGFVDQRR